MSVKRDGEKRSGLRHIGVVLSQEYRPERRGLLATSGLAVGSTTLEVVLVLVIASIGAGIVGKTEGAPAGLGGLFTIRQMAFGALALVALRAVLDLSRVLTETRVLRHYELRTRRGIVSAFLHAEWVEQTARNPGETVGVLMTYQGQAITTLKAIMSLASLGSGFVIMVIGSFLAGGASVLAILAGTAALGFAFTPLMARAHRAGRQLRDANRGYSGVWWEVAGSTLETRLFRAQDAMTERIDPPLVALVEAGADNARVSGLLGSMYGSAIYGIAVVGLGVLAVTDHERAPAYAAVILMLYRGLSYGRAVQSTYQTVLGQLPSVEALRTERAHLVAAATRQGGRALAPPIRTIGFEDVSFTYGTGSHALDHVDLVIEGGEAVGIVGPSGAGKSTLVQLLLALREPTEGRVLVNGVDLAEVALDSWYRHIALVPQESRVFQMTVLENVVCFRDDISVEEARTALRMAHALEEFEAFPQGLDTLIGGDWGHRISGGQRQRLAIARALAGRPDVLVMDEPTSALDLLSEEVIRETLAELKHRVTLVIIAHRLSTLRVCDRVLVMKGGRIDAVGARDQLTDDNDFFAEAVRLARLI